MTGGKNDLAIEKIYDQRENFPEVFPGFFCFIKSPAKFEKIFSFFKIADGFKKRFLIFKIPDEFCEKSF